MRQEGATIQQMSVDDLTERISLIFLEKARNARGDLVTVSENTCCTVWAKVLPLTWKIQDTTPERENLITYRITIRYRADLKPDDLIIWRARRLKMITPPVDIEARHIWLQFDCQEVVQDNIF